MASSKKSGGSKSSKRKTSSGSSKSASKKSSAKKSSGAKKSSSKSTKRPSGKRDLIKPTGGARFAKRDKKGQFTETTDMGRSQKADRRTKAKKKVKSGFGDQGDRG